MTSRRYRVLYHHRIRANDGQAVHVRELIEALRALGHEVLECALVRKTAATAHSAPAARNGQTGRAWQRLQLPRIAIEAMEIGYGGVGARRLVAAGRDFKPDFLYERHALHCTAGWRAAKRLGVPLLLEVNSPMVDEMHKLGLLRFAKRARRVERAVLGAADAVLAVTEVLRQRLIECGARAERTHVIANGADPERYGAAAAAAARSWRAGYAPDAFLLGFVGYMRPWHRLDLALEAMTDPRLARVHLVLLGEGPALTELQAKAVALQLGPRFHTMGVVSPKDLPSHLLALDAALIPAINTYASPLKLFDSLAAGVPTLAPDQPNLRERVLDGVTGLLFAPGSAASLTEKLASLVADPQRARQIGAAGRQALIDQRWTWTGNAERVTRIFAELSQ